jgi:hypothetical protein
MSGELRDRLARLIEDRLDDGKADLETLPNGHVSGHVVSSEFENQDYEQRRIRIREMLDDAVRRGDLDPDDPPRISTLLTYTPAEWTVASTDVS